MALREMISRELIWKTVSGVSRQWIRQSSFLLSFIRFHRLSKIHQELPHTFLPPSLTLPIIRLHLRKRTDNINHCTIMSNHRQYILLRIKIPHLRNTLPRGSNIMRRALNRQEKRLGRRRRRRV